MEISASISISTMMFNKSYRLINVITINEMEKHCKHLRIIARTEPVMILTLSASRYFLQIDPLRLIS